MEPFQLPFHTPDGRDPLQQLQDEYSIPLDERGQIDYQKLSGATAGPVEAPQPQQTELGRKAADVVSFQKTKEQQWDEQNRPRMTAAVKSELARRAAARIVQEQDYSAAPRVIRGDGTDEVLPDIQAPGGFFGWNRKEELASKGEHGGGFGDWWWKVGGEVGGFEATKSRNQGDVVSDDDINEMLQDVSDKNYAQFGSQYTLDPQEFKSQFKAHALAKAMFTEMVNNKVDWGGVDETNYKKIFRNMPPNEQLMFSNALDSMVEDEGIDEGPISRFVDSLGRGLQGLARTGAGVATLIGSKSDEQIEGEQIEDAAKALVDEKLAPAGIVGGALNTAAEILPPMLAGGFVGKATGATAVAARAGTKVASVARAAGGGAYWFDMTAGEVKDRLRAAGLDDSQATIFATPAAAAIAAMEFAQVGRFAKKFKGSNKELLAKVLEQTGGFKEKVLKNAVTRTLTKSAKTGIQEGGQEALQQAMEEGTMFLASKMHDSDFDLGESFDNIRHAFTDSVLAMAVIGMPGAVSGTLAEKRGVDGLRARMAVMEQAVSGRIDNLVLAASNSQNPEEFDELLDWAANPERAQEAFPDILRDALQGQEGVLEAPIESLEEFMGDRLKKAIVESVGRNRDAILEGREGAHEVQNARLRGVFKDAKERAAYVDYWLEESLGNAEERASSQAVADILIEHIENNEQRNADGVTLQDQLADLINDGTLSRSAFKNLLLSSGDTFRRDGSINPETPSGKLMLKLLEHIGSTGADAEVKQKYTAAELMNLSAADFNAWVFEVSGMPGQHIPVFEDLDAAVEAHPSTRETGQRRRKMRKEVEDSFAPGVSAAQERARLINEWMPEAKFVLPTSLLRLDNQNQRQRKIFSSVMKANLSLWMKSREKAAQAQEAGQAQQVEPQQVEPQQVGVAVQAQQEETQQTPLDEAGVERIANTIGDMFGEQGVIENEERVFEVIETALSGETEAKIEAQRELINIMGQLSEGKELSYLEHGWEPLPEDEKKVKELGNTFARLVDMGYLQHLDEISAEDVRALGLDHTATLQAAVEINKRMQAGEEVSREEMDNIIYEKHTGEELRVQRAANRTTMEAMVLGATQEVALAGKQGQTVPRSQMTPGEFVFTDPGTRGIGQIGKMLGEERRGKAAPEPMRGDPVAPVEQAEGGTVEQYKGLGEAQRGKPETAMLKFAGTHAGLLSNSVEHVGDLVHRVYESLSIDPDTGLPSVRLGSVKEKVESQLRSLRSGYGFGREVQENLENNARIAGESVEERKKRHDSLLEDYVDAHRNLPSYNEAQRVIKEAAVSLGEGRYEDTIKALETIQSKYQDEKTWTDWVTEGLTAEQAAPQEGSQESVMPAAVQDMGIYNWEDLEGYAEAQDIDPYEFARQLNIKTPSSDMSDADRAAKVKEINITAVDTFEEERLLGNEAERAARSGNNKRVVEIMTEELPLVEAKKKRQIQKKIEKAKTPEEKSYWKSVRDGNIDPVLQPPKDKRVKAKPKKRPKPKPVYDSASVSDNNELRQTAIETFGEDAGDFLEAVKNFTEDEELARVITSLASEHGSGTVDEALENAITALEELGFSTKFDVNGKKTLDTSPISTKEATKPVSTKEVSDRVDGASWWKNLSTGERVKHVLDGVKIVNIQLKRAGLPPVPESEINLAAAEDDRFPGGSIGRIAFAPKKTEDDREVVSVEIYFTPSGGKDFGAFVADVIMADDLSDEGYKTVSASSMIPSEWAEELGHRWEHDTNEVRLEEHRAIIQDLIDANLDSIITERVKSFYSGPDGMFTETGDGITTPEELDHLFAQTVLYEKKFDSALDEIIVEVMNDRPDEVYDINTGLADFKVLEPYIEEHADILAEEFSEIENIKDVFASFILENLPSAIHDEAVNNIKLLTEKTSEPLKWEKVKAGHYEAEVQHPNAVYIIKKNEKLPKAEEWEISIGNRTGSGTYAGGNYGSLSEAKFAVEEQRGIYEYKTTPAGPQEGPSTSTKQGVHILGLEELQRAAEIDDTSPARKHHPKRKVADSAVGVIKKMYKAAPDFGFDPTFDVVEVGEDDLELVYKDGVTYRFPSDMFMPYEPVDERRSSISLNAGDKVTIDITTLGKSFRPKTKEQVIKDLFKNYGFLRARTSGDTITAKSKSGRVIEIKFVGDGIEIIKDGGSKAAVEEIKAFSDKLSKFSDEMLTGGDEDDDDTGADRRQRARSSAVGFKMPEIKTDTGDIVPNLSVTGDSIMFTDREGRERSIGEFATPEEHQVFLVKDEDKEKDISQKDTRWNKWATGGWKNLPAADGEIDIDYILTVAPGLEYIGIQSDVGPDVHGFKAAHGEVLHVRAVKFIPQGKIEGYSAQAQADANEILEETGVSSIEGTHISVRGEKVPHVILISEMGLASPTEVDGGVELEEIIHWAQLSGRWSPEINELLQKEFSRQALASGVTQPDQIEDTAKGLAIAITKALKQGDPASVGPVRDLLRKLLNWFNDFLIASGAKPMDVDYIVKKWLSGELIGNPESLELRMNVMKRQRKWKERKSLTPEEKKEIGEAAEKIDDMHVEVSPSTISAAAHDVADTMANRIGRLARVKRDSKKVARAVLEPGRTKGVWTTLKSFLRETFRVVPLEGAEARQELLKLAEERRGFAGTYSALAKKYLKQIEKAKKEMGIENFSEKVKELMYLATKNEETREKLKDDLTSEITDTEQLALAMKGFGDIQRALGKLRETMDELSQIVIDDETQRSEEMAVILDKNLGVYVNRKYRLFEDPKGRKMFLMNTAEGKQLVKQAAVAIKAIDFRKKYDKEKERLYKKWKKGEKLVGLLKEQQEQFSNAVTIYNMYRRQAIEEMENEGMDKETIAGNSALIDEYANAHMREWFMDMLELPEIAERIKNIAEKKTISERKAKSDVISYLYSPTSGRAGDEGLRGNREQFLPRKDLDEALKKLYGEIRGAEAVGISISKLADNIAGHRFQKSLVESALFDNHINERGEGDESRNVELKGHEYGVMNGLFVTPEFENAINSVTGAKSWAQQGRTGILSELGYMVMGLSHASRGMKTIMNPKTGTRNSIEEHVHAWINGWWSPVRNTGNRFGLGDGSHQASLRQALAIAENHADVDASQIIKYIALPGLGNVKALFAGNMDLKGSYDAEAAALHKEISELGLLNNSLQAVWDEQRDQLDVSNPLDILTRPDTPDIKIDSHERAEGVTKIFRKVIGKLSNNQPVKAAARLYQVPSDAVRVMGYVKEKANINRAIAEEVKQSLKGEQVTQAELEEAIKEMQEKRRKETNRDAADKVKDLVPTASRVPQMVKNLSLIPIAGNFPVWFTGYVKTMANQWKIGMGELNSKNKVMQEVGLHRLLRASFSQAAFGALASGMYMLFGFDDDDMEAIRNAVPEYQRNHTLIPVPNPFGEGFHIFDVSQSFPSVMFMDILATTKRGYSKEGISAALSEGLGQALSPFTDEDIYTSNIADIFWRGGENRFGYKVWDSLDNRFTKFRKGLDHAIFGISRGGRGPLTPGLIPELNRLKQAVFDEETPSGIKRSIPSYLSRNMLGSEAIMFVPETMLTMKAKEFTDTRREYTRSVNKAGYSSNSSKFKKALEAFELKNARLYNEMKSVVHAARLGGMSDGDIVLRLQKFGVPKTDIQHWMAGKVRGTTMSKKTLQGIYTAAEERGEGGGQEILDVYIDYVKRGDRGE